jgi:hypothetical protein
VASDTLSPSSLDISLGCSLELALLQVLSSTQDVQHVIMLRKTERALFVQPLKEKGMFTCRVNVILCLDFVYIATIVLLILKHQMLKFQLKTSQDVSNVEDCFDHMLSGFMNHCFLMC